MNKFVLHIHAIARCYFVPLKAGKFMLSFILVSRAMSQGAVTLQEAVMLQGDRGT